MNKGDVILIVILTASAAAVGLNEWNIIHDYEQFSSYEWQFLQALLAGELLFFAIYKVGKKSAEAFTYKRSGRVAEQLEDEWKAGKHEKTEGQQ